MAVPSTVSSATETKVKTSVFSSACHQADGSAQGDGRIRVGTRLTLEGLGPRFSNTYYVTAACHRFDRTDGYRTDFTAECAFLGEL